MVSAAVDRWHRLDVLVCNAAASDDSLLLRLSDEAWDRVLAITLTGVFLCLQSAGAVMQAQGDGSVILIGDRKSTRLNSSHVRISYAVFCLKKKNKHKQRRVRPVLQYLTQSS